MANETIMSPNRKLLKAVQNNDFPAMQKALDEGAILQMKVNDNHEPDRSGQYGLASVSLKTVEKHEPNPQAYKEALEILDFLLQNLQLNASSLNKLLLEARDKSSTYLLLKCGADPNCRIRTSTRYAFIKAALCGRLETLGVFLTMGANISHITPRQMSQVARQSSLCADLINRARNEPISVAEFGVYIPSRLKAEDLRTGQESALPGRAIVASARCASSNPGRAAVPQPCT